ncbi:MAG: hypothetical protein EBT57_02285 [Verrucomicrobia bacterium]|nr:hypothetical protein [Verrucomicrobiota bacterium]
MRILREKSGDRTMELAAPEAALLRQALESTAEAYRTDPGELDPMVGNAWYGRAGLREAGIRGEDALHWIEGLHEVRLGREKTTRHWIQKLPAVGQPGVWRLPGNEVDVFLATLNDHRLRRAAEFDLGEGDLEVTALERAKGDKRIALVEIHFLAWIMEMILHE